MNYTVIIAPLWENKAKMLFAQRVFALKLDEKGEYSIEEDGPGKANIVPVRLGVIPKTQAMKKYIEHMEKNGVRVVDRPGTEKDVEDAIDWAKRTFSLP